MTDKNGIKFKFESPRVSFEHGHTHSWGCLGTAVEEGTFLCPGAPGDYYETVGGTDAGQ